MIQGQSSLQNELCTRLHTRDQGEAIRTAIRTRRLGAERVIAPEPTLLYPLGLVAQLQFRSLLDDMTRDYTPPSADCTRTAYLAKSTVIFRTRLLRLSPRDESLFDRYHCSPIAHSAACCSPSASLPTSTSVKLSWFELMLQLIVQRLPS